MVVFLPNLLTVESPQLERQLLVDQWVEVRSSCHPELSGSWQISKDGTLTIPQFGRFRAAGRRLTDLTGAIRMRVILAGSTPDVIVQLESRAPMGLRIEGAVVRPYDVPWRASGFTVGDLLELVPLVTGAGSSILVTDVRGKIIRLTTRDVGSRLQPGDTVNFLPAGAGDRVSMTGAIKLPGSYDTTNSQLTLAAALALGGGASPDANLSKIVLTRRGESFPLTLPDDSGFQVQGGDSIWVSPQADQGVVFLRGRVKREGYVNLFAGCTLLDAIKGAGGPMGDPARLQVILRYGQGAGAKEFVLSYSFLAEGRVPNPVLMRAATIELQEKPRQ